MLNQKLFIKIVLIKQNYKLHEKYIKEANKILILRFTNVKHRQKSMLISMNEMIIDLKRHSINKRIKSTECP